MNDFEEKITLLQQNLAELKIINKRFANTPTNHPDFEELYFKYNVLFDIIRIRYDGVRSRLSLEHQKKFDEILTGMEIVRHFTISLVELEKAARRENESHN